MTNPVTKDRRHFEDLALGEVVQLGQTTVTKDMIISFAREFDPFPFHLDEAAAKASLLGGLASSGWQTGALKMNNLLRGVRPNAGDAHVLAANLPEARKSSGARPRLRRKALAR